MEKNTNEKSRRRYYKNREKRILYQREYDKLHKDIKNNYEKKRRLKDDYYFKKKIQHYSQKYHFPVLIKIHGHCQICGSKEKLQIHHAKYTNRIEDCMLICLNCHKAIHRKPLCL